MTLEIYEQIVSILKGIIKDTKFENHTYTVGGCERDRILGNEIKDFQAKILEIDPTAFIIFSESQQIVGNGFYVYK